MNDREIGAYRRITAPPSLRTHLLMAAAASRPRHQRRPMAAAAAACLVLTLLFALIGSRAPAVVIMDGRVIGSKGRPVTSAAAARTDSAEEIFLSLTVSARGTAQMSVTRGELKILGHHGAELPVGADVTVDGPTAFAWRVPLTAEVPRLTVTWRNGAASYVLQPDETGQKWFIAKE